MDHSYPFELVIEDSNYIVLDCTIEEFTNYS